MRVDRSEIVRTSRGILFAALLWISMDICFCTVAYGVDEKCSDSACCDATKVQCANAKRAEHQSPWFILPSLINVYPKLESEKPIVEYYNPIMRLLAPDFDDVRTVGTLRDAHILWTPDFAIGRVMSRYLALYVHVGYSAGTVRTKATNASVFLVPLRTDFQIYRSAAYVGLCADLFPFGMPERKKYGSLMERLRNTKPSIGLRFTENYAGYRAKTNAAFPAMRLFEVDLKDNWWVAGLNANLGADVPLSERDALTLNAGYNFALTRGFDFDAAAFTLGWKHYFK